MNQKKKVMSVPVPADFMLLQVATRIIMVSTAKPTICSRAINFRAFNRTVTSIKVHASGSKWELEDTLRI